MDCAMCGKDINSYPCPVCGYNGHSNINPEWPDENEQDEE